MSVPTIPGVEARTIETERLATRVLFSGPDDGIPVLFLHGNLSNATWWESTMTALPEGYRGIAPDQRGYGGADPEALIDSTNGMGDLSDDAAALLDTLGIESAHVVGNSMGGSILWRMMADHSERIRSAIHADPGSPYGYGGTKDAEGTPTNSDFAGSGAGLVNPQMVERLRSGDMGTDDQVSPRNVFRESRCTPRDRTLHAWLDQASAAGQAAADRRTRRRLHPGDARDPLRRAGIPRRQRAIGELAVRRPGPVGCSQRAVASLVTGSGADPRCGAEATCAVDQGSGQPDHLRRWATRCR